MKLNSPAYKLPNNRKRNSSNAGTGWHTGIKVLQIDIPNSMRGYPERSCQGDRHGYQYLDGRRAYVRCYRVSYDIFVDLFVECIRIGETNLLWCVMLKQTHRSRL